MADGYTDENIASKVEMTQFRWGMSALIVGIVTVLGCLTFSCADSRMKDADQKRADTQITAGQKVECVKAGGSWIPVQGVKMSNGQPYPDYDMGCVSQSAQGAIIAQNSKVIETFKPKD